MMTNFLQILGGSELVVYAMYLAFLFGTGFRRQIRLLGFKWKNNTSLQELDFCRLLIQQNIFRLC